MIEQEQNNLSLEFAKDFLKYVHEDLLQIKAPHFDIAFRLYEAKQRGYSELLGYADIYDLAEKEFSLGKTSVKNYIAVCSEYMGGHIHLLSKYEKYSFTQLVEMLPISSSELSLIKPEMTVKQIREWKQEHKLILFNNIWKLWGELTDKEKRQYELEHSKNKTAENSGRTSDHQEEEIDGGQLTDQNNFGIYVKTIMEVFPSCCTECFYYSPGYKLCNALREDIYNSTIRPDWCPLVEIKPQG